MSCMESRINDIEKRLVILESSMKEPEDKTIKIGGYQELALRITNANQRIGELENKVGSKNPKKELGLTIEQLAERVTRLEKIEPEERLGAGHTGACLDGCQCDVARAMKPDTIQIPRKVAVEWADVWGPGHVGGVTEELAKAINKALGR